MKESWDDQGLRGMLRGLPEQAPGETLRARLRVMASQEAARARKRRSLSSRLADLAESAGIWIDNLMRPYAVPVTGGVISAVMLFSVIAPAYPMRQPSAGDVPMRVWTGASLVTSFSLDLVDDEEMVVDVTVDVDGRMTGYTLPGNQRWATDPGIRRSLENTLLCTKFNPARLFGQPMAGRVRISLRRSEVEVRG
jgi:hypothetical protein